MITGTKYNALKRKIAAFDKWVDTQRSVNGWASFLPSDVPKHIKQVSNAERSSVEVYEFIHNPPEKYLVYIRRNVIKPGLVDSRIEATTWTGQVLGYGKLGKFYRCGRSRRYSVVFQGINGHSYKGTFYASSGDYARVHKVKA